MLNNGTVIAFLHDNEPVKQKLCQKTKIREHSLNIISKSLFQTFHQHLMYLNLYLHSDVYVKLPTLTQFVTEVYIR